MALVPVTLVLQVLQNQSQDIMLTVLSAGSPRPLLCHLSPTFRGLAGLIQILSLNALPEVASGLLSAHLISDFSLLELLSLFMTHRIASLCHVYFL